MSSILFHSILFHSIIKLSVTKLTKENQFLGLLFGFLPVIAPSLRGNMTDDQCWFILVNAELILATTIIGIVPVFVVVVLYSIILHKALKKVGEMKRATSVVNAANGIETGDRNTLRYFRGSASDLRQTSDRDQDTTNITPLRHPSKSTSLRRKFCCLRWRWCCCSQTENTATTAVSEGIVLTTSTPRRKPPSKWKAIKVVLFTTGSFVITWVRLHTIYSYLHVTSTFALGIYCWRIFVICF